MRNEGEDTGRTLAALLQKQKGLQRWLGNGKYILLSHRTHVQFPASVLASSQPPITPALAYPTHSSGLWEQGTWARVHTSPHRHTHINNIFWKRQRCGHTPLVRVVGRQKQAGISRSSKLAWSMCTASSRPARDAQGDLMSVETKLKLKQNKNPS